MTRTIRMKDITGLKANATTAPYATTEPTKIGGVRGGTTVDPGGDGNYLPINGSLIFSSDFSNRPDWQNQHANQRLTSPGSTANDGTSGYVAANNIPDGFDLYYTTEYHHPNGDENGSDPKPGTQPVGQISNIHGSHDSLTGKSLVIYDESTTGGGWGADCVIIREMQDQLEDAVIEFYVKFSPDFLFQGQVEGFGTHAMKVFRLKHWYGSSTDNRFGFGTPASSDVFLNLKCYTSEPGRHLARMSVRIDTYGGGGQLTDEANVAPGTEVYVSDHFMDGNWHRVVLRARLNSDFAVADGTFQAYWDDYLVLEINNIPWDSDSTRTQRGGWNHFELGGNANNNWAADGVVAEQWWAISGFRAWSGIPSELSTYFNGVV